MFLFQDVKNTITYKTGYVVGQWIAHNPILAVLTGAVFSVGFVWVLTKVVKQIRIFGE
ncbi:hypothetical protein [Tenacibaculum caenipelagi]|uniref:Uncharacterized protein n=1 Tax=Tenacibaculum caenipelagi TaxID=1325435 RepID=A0A4R6TFI4_9FLAO|nr:hypothetical protein [Tenacibaculum caenipelagi]TDQ28738.1 hypothetical protein DFQ07_1116 [Tenacibaculum caenipelagi]